MSDFTTDEPPNHYIEIVDVGTWFRSTPDITITFMPKSDCKVKNGAGKIIGTKRTITIETRNGSTFRITRYANGEYKAKSWFTWVNRRQ